MTPDAFKSNLGGKNTDLNNNVKKILTSKKKKKTQTEKSKICK